MRSPNHPNTSLQKNQSKEVRYIILITDRLGLVYSCVGFYSVIYISQCKLFADATISVLAIHCGLGKMKRSQICMINYKLMQI